MFIILRKVGRMNKKKKKIIRWSVAGVALLLVVIVVASLFGGQDAVFSRIIYTLVGLAGLWCISLLFRRGKEKFGAE